MIMNNNNFNFYNNLGVDPFKKLAAIGGFSSYKDLELCYPYIKDAKSILELGAGYGRCLDFFIEKNYKGKLIAVEQSAPLIEYLKAHYSAKADILQEDIKDLKLDQKVDVALWMWSGVIDFAKEEQLTTIQKIASYLSPKGKLIIDIPKLGYKTYANHQDEQTLRLDSTYGTLECYIPNEKEMKEICEKSGFKELKTMHYSTSTEKERTLYILSKERIAISDKPLRKL
jgi:SAM-dependent methyltransferase